MPFEKIAHFLVQFEEKWPNFPKKCNFCEKMTKKRQNSVKNHNFFRKKRGPSPFFSNPIFSKKRGRLGGG